jgi:hypothetical protein
MIKEDGCPPSTVIPMRSYSSTHTVTPSCKPTNGIFRSSSQIMRPLGTEQSSSSIRSFERNLQGMLDSPSTMLNPTSLSFSGLSIPQKVQGSLEEREVTPKSVDGSILALHTSTAGSGTSVIGVEETIAGPHAQRTMRRKGERLNEWKMAVRDPRYLRGFIWGEGEPCTPSVTSTLFKKPLSGIPEEDMKHEWVTNTIHEYPYLFEVVTPIRYENLRSVLHSHPNRPFVDSILLGFRDGFWPAAKSDLLVSLQQGHDNRRQEEFLDDSIREFLRDQRDVEISLGRFSQSFGPDLLPGMVAQPCFAVPKPGSSKFRLVNDHTAGHSSLNAAIPPEDGSF